MESTGTVSASSSTALPPGIESARIRLQADDLTGALSDAETAVARGGDADAYAVRADVKRAMGRPSSEIAPDYQKASQLDPRYLEKYHGYLAQVDSEQHPGKSASSTGLGGIPAGFLFVGLVLGAFLIIVGWIWLYKRSKNPLENRADVEPGSPVEKESKPKSEGKEPPPDTGQTKKF